MLIVIQGASATGKTSLAKRLSSDTGILCLSKDDFKEMLYDKLGKPASREESAEYGRAATASLYAACETFIGVSRNVIIESAFAPGLAEQDIKKIMDSKMIKVVQLYCAASPEICMQRFNARIKSGERHPGHPDNEGEHDINVFVQKAQKYTKLDIEDTIYINTDNFTTAQYEQTLSQVKKRMEDK